MVSPPEAPCNAEGRKVKAALVEDDPVPRYNAANNTSIIEAGAPARRIIYALAGGNYISYRSGAMRGVWGG
jgi:hypothetical protein